MLPIRRRRQVCVIILSPPPPRDATIVYADIFADASADSAARLFFPRPPFILPHYMSRAGRRLMPMTSAARHDHAEIVAVSAPC
jgi:hypothetical protein